VRENFGKTLGKKSFGKLRRHRKLTLG
jgi:hypothetical protein